MNAKRKGIVGIKGEGGYKSEANTAEEKKERFGLGFVFDESV